MLLRHTLPRLTLLAVAMAMVMTLSACGGDDEPTLEDAGPEIATSPDGSESTDGADSAPAGDDVEAEPTTDPAAVDEPDADTAEAVGPPLPTPVAPSGEPAFTSASNLTTVGLGDVFFGDTVRAIRSKLDGSWVGLPAADARPSCFTMQPAGGPEGTVFMILDGRVERIDIASPDITTRSGIGVGSTEADIIELFEANIETTPTDAGNQIEFIPTDADDRQFRIVWDTDGATVVAMRAGRLPGVLDPAPCA